MRGKWPGKGRGDRALRQMGRRGNGGDGRAIERDIIREEGRMEDRERRCGRSREIKRKKRDAGTTERTAKNNRK